MAVANSTLSPLVQFLPSPSQWNTNSSAIPAIAAFVVAFLSAFFLRSTKSDGIYDLGGIPVFTAWDFFKKPFNFFQGHFKKTGGEMFRFRVLQASSNYYVLPDC